jgi:hypothetical protein
MREIGREKNRREITTNTYPIYIDISKLNCRVGNYLILTTFLIKE